MVLVRLVAGFVASLLESSVLGMSWFPWYSDDDI